MLIFPSSSSLSNTWVRSISYFTAVVNSEAYCPNPPSLEIETTGRPAKGVSGSCVAAHAPSAAGNEKPIDPR